MLLPAYHVASPCDYVTCVDIMCSVCFADGGSTVKGIDDISRNVPHGVFLVKKPKLASFESGHPSIATAGLRQSKNVFLPCLDFVLHWW